MCAESQNEATAAMLLCTRKTLPMKECALTCPVCQVEDSRLAAGEQGGHSDNLGHSRSSEAITSSVFPEAEITAKSKNTFQMINI